MTNNIYDWREYVKQLDNKIKAARIEKKEIATITGIARPNITRFFKLEAVPTLKTYIQILHAYDEIIDSRTED